MADDANEVKIPLAPEAIRMIASPTLRERHIKEWEHAWLVEHGYATATQEEVPSIVPQASPVVVTEKKWEPKEPATNDQIIGLIKKIPKIDLSLLQFKTSINGQLRVEILKDRQVSPKEDPNVADDNVTGIANQIYNLIGRMSGPLTSSSPISNKEEFHDREASMIAFEIDASRCDLSLATEKKMAFDANQYWTEMKYELRPAIQRITRTNAHGTSFLIAIDESREAEAGIAQANSAAEEAGQRLRDALPADAVRVVVKDNTGSIEFLRRLDPAELIKFKRAAGIEALTGAAR